MPMTSEPTEEMDEIDPDAEEESLVVTHTTPTGQSVILSRAALETYGEAYINQAALSTGKSRLVFADEDVLEDAEDRFPDSDTPLIDAYSDYMSDGHDLARVQDDLIVKGRVLTGNEKEEYIVKQNQRQDADLQTRIVNNSPAVSPQPNGNSAFIVIPSADTLRDDSFKNKMIKSLSHLDPSYFDTISSTSMDFAKFSISHEIGHIKFGYIEKKFQDGVIATQNGYLESPADKIRTFNTTLTGEIMADRSAAAEFNAASGAESTFPRFFADLRLIGDFMTGSDIIDLGGNGDRLNEHNTGDALHDYIQNQSTTVDTNKTQFTATYTHSLISGFIGATSGPPDDGYVYAIGGKKGNPANPGFRTINKEGFEAALAGDDPTQIISRGNNIRTSGDIYAAAKAMLENGQFDHSPDSKKYAERFVSAIERNAPSVIEPDLVDHYREALADPRNQNFLEHLHRYNNPEQMPIGYLYGGAAQSPSAAPAPAPEM